MCVVFPACLAPLKYDYWYEVFQIERMVVVLWFRYSRKLRAGITSLLRNVEGVIAIAFLVNLRLEVLGLERGFTFR